MPATGDRITKRRDGLLQGMHAAHTPDVPRRKYVSARTIAGGVSPEKGLPIAHDGDTRTVDDPDGSGFSEQLHIAPLTVSDEEVPLRYAQGGAFAELHLAQGPKARGPFRRRKRRSQVGGYSRASRFRLCRTLASIPRDSKALFITLTYPPRCRADAESAKRYHLQAFKKRFERRYGVHAAVWRMEFCGGVPHFHLLDFFPNHPVISKALLAEIREWVARAWWEICGRISEEHLRAGTSVERPRSLVRTMKYISKAEPSRIGSSPGEGPPRHVGRRWGVWRKGLLPIVWVETRVSLKDAFRLRSILRKRLGLKNRPGVVTFRVFVRDDHIERLLGHLGYAAPDREDLAYGPGH
jgi:hypothetical protein